MTVPKVPAGFALRIAELEAHGWTWVGFSYRGTVTSSPVIDGHQVETETPAVHTIVSARHWEAVHGDEVEDLIIWAHWVDGKWYSGWSRHPHDPAPVAFGARALSGLLTLEQPAPRWVRPDLDAPRKPGGPSRGDEGTPAHERWSPDIERRVLAGMERLRQYERSRERRRA